MRRMKLGVAFVTLAALVATGIAVADGKKPANITAVSAHFTGTGNVQTRTCTRGTVTLVERRGTFTGTATSTDPRLNGSARVDLKTIVNSATGFGVATGKFRVRSSTRGQAQADLMAVVSGTNRLDGFLRGNTENAEGSRRLSDNNNHGGKLFANFTATLAGTTLTGDLGTGGHLNTAVIAEGGCGD